MIVIQSPSYFEEFLKNNPSSSVNWYDLSTGFTPELNFFRGTATVFFAYTCHVGAFPVYKTLKHNVIRRINKVFRRSILLDAFVYVIVGTCGFLTQPIGTPDLIIYREPKFGGIDLAMLIARLLIAVNLTLSAPANYNAFRLSILELVWGTNEVSNKQ